MGALAAGDLRGAEHEGEVADRGAHRDDEHRGGDGVEQVAGQDPEDGHQRRRARHHAGRHEQQPAALVLPERVGDGEGEGRELVPPVDEGHQRDGHADRGGEEAGVVAVVLAQPAGHQGGGHGADVDGHVEQLEAGVPPDVVVVVQAADDRRQVRLDEAGADGDQDDPRPGEGGDGDRQADVAGHDDHAPVKGRRPRPDDPVGEDAPGNGQQVDGGAVGGQDDLAGVVAQAQAAVRRGVGDEVQQDGAHPVVGETLSHLDVEHPGQAPGVAEQSAVLPRRGGAQRARPPPAGGYDGGRGIGTVLVLDIG